MPSFTPLKEVLSACVKVKPCAPFKEINSCKLGFHKDSSQADGFQGNCKACKKSWTAARLCAKAEVINQQVHMLLTLHVRSKFQVWSSKQYLASYILHYKSRSSMML